MSAVGLVITDQLGYFPRVYFENCFSQSSIEGTVNEIKDASGNMFSEFCGSSIGDEITYTTEKCRRIFIAVPLGAGCNNSSY